MKILKVLSLAGIALVVGLIFFQKTETRRVAKESIVKRARDSLSRPRRLKTETDSRNSGGAQTTESERPSFSHKQKDPRPETRDWEVLLPLDDTYAVLRNVYAVRQTEYREGSYEEVKREHGFVILAGTPRPMNASPVAYDKANGRYLPIGSVIKVYGVDSQQRQDLIAKGYTEYYFHKELGLLYLQSSPEKVLELREELIAAGLPTELEFVKPPRRSR